jgi:hypothetical protein
MAGIDAMAPADAVADGIALELMAGMVAWVVEPVPEPQAARVTVSAVVTATAARARREVRIRVDMWWLSFQVSAVARSEQESAAGPVW